MAKAFELQPTTNPDLFRIVDREGDWTHYYIESEKRSVRSVNFVLDNGFSKGKWFYEAVKKSSPEEWDEKLKRAGDKGDAVHQAIKTLLSQGRFDRLEYVTAEDNRNLRMLSNDEYDCVLAFGRFWNDHQSTLLIQETAIVNKEVGYAGTFDMIAVLTKKCESRYCKCKDFIGKVGLWDHKSGAGIYANYGPQVAAYAMAFDKPIDYTAIDRVGTSHASGYQLEFYDESETRKHFTEFIAAMHIHDATYSPFSLERENHDIPDEVVITAPVAQPVIRSTATKKLRTNEKHTNRNRKDGGNSPAQTSRASNRRRR